jgi:LmbE family N-acetylglucosaminyl deacetylase
LTPRPDDRSPLAGRTVLAVFAHPDDESLACGGTLARLADAGARIVLMCASHGERGSRVGPVHDTGLGLDRARELRAAAGALGVSRLIILDHPDGELRWEHVSELRAQIAMTITRYAPAAVITFGSDGLYWHLDHIGVHERTTTAVRSLGLAAPPLYYVTMPRGLMRAIADKAIAAGWTPPANGLWSLEPDAFGSAAAPPTLVVDVRAWATRKLAAIRCHQTQAGSNDPFAYIDDDETRAWLSVEHFHRAPGHASADEVLELIGEPVTSS